MPVLNPAARTLTVQYGTFTLDETNGITLDANPRRYSIRESYYDGDFSIEFLVRGTSDAAFTTLCNSLEAALEIPRQKLTVKLGGNVINGGGSAWDPTSGVRSAFLIMPTIEKIGGEEDSGRIRKYRFSVHCQFPADLTGQAWRQDSSTLVATTMLGRRTATITGVWTASSAGTALANYQANGDAFFNAYLPTPVANGEWEKVSDPPLYDDENAVLQVTRTYLEVVNGLREYQVQVDQPQNQTKVVTISGFYMPTTTTPGNFTAQQNYANNVGALATNILAAVGLVNYEGTSVPKKLGYDTTGQRYFFTHVYKEILLNESASAVDDPNVADHTLTVALEQPHGPQTITPSIKVQRLQRASATYVAIFDKTQTTDPNSIWAGGLRSYVVSLISSKLGSISVGVEDEQIDVSPDGNSLTARLSCFVKGSNVLSLQLREKIRRTGALNLVPLANGAAHAYFPYKQPPRKVLSRAAVAEILVGQPIPKLFGDTQASGFDLVATGISAQESLDQQELGNVPSSVPGWICVGLDEDHFPTSRGDDDSFQTVLVTQAEDWIYVASFASGASGGQTVSR